MSISTTCSACEHHFEAPEKYGGKRVKCPQCESPLTVGNQSEELTITREVEATDTIRCPFCDEPIRKRAKKCKHCGSMIEKDAGVAKERPIMRLEVGDTFLKILLIVIGTMYIVDGIICLNLNLHLYAIIIIAAAIFAFYLAHDLSENREAVHRDKLGWAAAFFLGFALLLTPWAVIPSSILLLAIGIKYIQSGSLAE